MKLYTPRIPEEREQTLPLVNIVFLLLIFFMIAGKLTEPDAFNVSPPQSASQVSPEPQVVTVSIASDGRLAAGGEEHSLDTLKLFISEKTTSTEVLSVRLKADGAVDAQLVIEVMDILRNAGVEKIWMLTDFEER